MANNENKTAPASKIEMEVVKDLELGINIAKPKDINQTNDLELANHELCDAYMNYKDLANQCIIDFGTIQATDGPELASIDDNLITSTEQPVKTSTQNMSKINSSSKQNDTFVSEEDHDLQSDKQDSLKSTTFQKKESKTKYTNIKNKKVFYFAPNSFLMQDPEKQRQFRDQFIKQIKQPPQLRMTRLLAEDLQQQIIESVADRSNPTNVRKMLAQFFLRKQYNLMHKRYKLLIRWAHHAIRTRNIDTIGQQATFRCSKLQQDIDSSIKRYQRLVDDDDYERGLQSHLRPSSRGKDSSGTLYVEIKDLPAQSAIRQDDIEVYLRSVTYSSKVQKMVNKYMARLKWLPLSQ